jgi:ketosteroid isomerase-like protein
VYENCEVVRAWMAAVNDRRLDDQLALTDPEFEMVESHALPGAARVKGREQLRSYSYGWARNWSDWEWREEEMTELPQDRVVLTALLRLKGLRSSIWVERRWAYLITVRDRMILRVDGFETKDEILGFLEAEER